MGLSRRLLLWASHQRWIGRQAQRRRFTRRAVRRFMPGEDLEAALGAGRRLAGSGITTILHELGENVASAEQAEAATACYEEALARGAAAGLDAQISVKLTHLGLDVDAGLADRNLERLVGRAESLSRLVWIDMESSAYVEGTLAAFRRARERSPAVGLCLQAYLRRSAADLESLLPLGPALRLVKGAYDEPASLAWPARADVDANFLSLASRLLQQDARERGVRLSAATHDEALIARIVERARGARVPPEDYELQMLYGIRREAQLRLASGGQRVRVLISYGPDWYPWFVRRLAERPANLWFVLRSLYPATPRRR
jgi:proline dehydrogenase